MKTLIASMLASLIAIGAATAYGADKPTDVQKSKSGEDGLIRVATCNDGKEYWARTNEHRGACSGHGGVAAWADGSEVKSHGRKTSYR
jgi:hypothetical protein